jgi:hypothetical protein
MKKPNGMFTINHETSTGKNMDLGVNRTIANNAIDASKEFTILTLTVVSSILPNDANLDKKL